MRGEARRQGISTRNFEAVDIHTRWFTVLKPRLEAEGAQRAAMAGADSVATDPAQGFTPGLPLEVAIPWTKEENRLLLSLLRDHSVEEVAEYMNSEVRRQ